MESCKTFIFTTLEYAFGNTRDAIFNALEQGFGYYSKSEFLSLLYQAKKECNELVETVKQRETEIKQLRSEIEFMNTHMFAALNRDVMHMRSKLNSVMHTTPLQRQRFVEELDV
jgi:cell division protein FtsB